MGIYNRQQLSSVVGPYGALFVLEVDRFLAMNGFPSERIGAIEMPADRSVDIDTLNDLHGVELVLQTRRSASKGA
jgi:N-acylneuraminate cytidylyltransferase